MARLLALFVTLLLVGTALAEPGDAVVWLDYPVQKPVAARAGWGAVLTDIEAHLPARYGRQYASADLVTHGHETTHGVNSDVRNRFGKGRQNGLYCLNSQAALVVDPRVTIQQIAPLVPRSLRASRYNLYLVQQAGSWGNQPTYLCDEWVAYTNGAAVGLDQWKAGQASREHSDTIIGPLEFSYYALALLMATERHDPAYLRTADGVQLSEFVAHELRRASLLYTEGSAIPHFQWDNRLRESFATAADARELRELAVRWFGPAFVTRYLMP